MKIFGIGLNKTGTSTLGVCLKQWGLKHISCHRKAFELWREGNYEELLRIVDDNDSFEDWPWPLLYKEVNARFPDTKFVLTRRKNADIWFKSLCTHAELTGPTDFRKHIYGFEMPHNHKEQHIKFYERHIETVRSYFRNRPDKFLEVCWEEGDGWDQLSSFFGLAPPCIPFPHINKSHNAKIHIGEKVTVAVPFYGVELYIAKCLESLVGQTFQNIEILCIDDCSPDNSLQIVEEYAGRDSRIKIVRHEKNQGLGGARNTGINNATGDYICFVDSDDYVSSRFVELLYRSITTNHSDIAACGFYGFDDDSGDVLFCAKYEDSNLHLRPNKENIFEVENQICPASWLKIYKRDWLLRNGIIQPEESYYEGVVFWLKAVYYSSKISTISDILYFYRQRPGSIMTTFSEKHIVDRLSFIQHADHFFKTEILPTPNIDINKVTKDALSYILKHLRYGYKLLERADRHDTETLKSYYEKLISGFAESNRWPILHASLSQENKIKK